MLEKDFIMNTEATTSQVQDITINVDIIGKKVDVDGNILTPTYLGLGEFARPIRAFYDHGTNNAIVVYYDHHNHGDTHIIVVDNPSTARGLYWSVFPVEHVFNRKDAKNMRLELRRGNGDKLDLYANGKKL